MSLHDFALLCRKNGEMAWFFFSILGWSSGAQSLTLHSGITPHEELEGSYRVLGFKPGSAASKENALPTLLCLTPREKVQHMVPLGPILYYGCKLIKRMWLEKDGIIASHLRIACTASRIAKSPRRQHYVTNPCLLSGCPFRFTGKCLGISDHRPPDCHLFVLKMKKLNPIKKMW